MNKLDTAKDIIQKYYYYGDCGIFDCRNTVGDDMTTIYDDEELQIDICYPYSYFEVFGLSDKEFNDLEQYYRAIEKMRYLHEREDS